jgi:hypothetical protein
VRGSPADGSRGAAPRHKRGHTAAGKGAGGLGLSRRRSRGGAVEMGSLHAVLRSAATKCVVHLPAEEKQGRAVPEEEAESACRLRSPTLVLDWAGVVDSLTRHIEGGRFSPIASEKVGGARPWPPGGGLRGQLHARPLRACRIPPVLEEGSRPPPER